MLFIVFLVFFLRNLVFCFLLKLFVRMLCFWSLFRQVLWEMFCCVWVLFRVFSLVVFVLLRFMLELICIELLLFLLSQLVVYFMVSLMQFWKLCMVDVRQDEFLVEFRVCLVVVLFFGCLCMYLVLQVVIWFFRVFRLVWFVVMVVFVCLMQYYLFCMFLVVRKLLGLMVIFCLVGMFVVVRMGKCDMVRMLCWLFLDCQCLMFRWVRLISGGLVFISLMCLFVQNVMRGMKFRVVVFLFLMVYLFFFLLISFYICQMLGFRMWICLILIFFQLICLMVVFLMWMWVSIFLLLIIMVQVVMRYLGLMCIQYGCMFLVLLLVRVWVIVMLVVLIFFLGVGWFIRMWEKFLVQFLWNQVWQNDCRLVFCMLMFLDSFLKLVLMFLFRMICFWNGLLVRVFRVCFVMLSRMVCLRWDLQFVLVLLLYWGRYFFLVVCIVVVLFRRVLIIFYRGCMCRQVLDGVVIVGFFLGLLVIVGFLGQL